MDGREPVSGYICLLYCIRYEFSTSRLSITFQQHRRNLADSGHRPEKAVTHNRIIIPRITRTSQFKTDTPSFHKEKDRTRLRLISFFTGYSIQTDSKEGAMHKRRKLLAAQNISGFIQK